MTENNKRLLKTLGVVFAVFICLIFLINMCLAEIHINTQQETLSSLTYFEDFSLPLFDRSAGAPSKTPFTAEDLKAYKVIFINGWGPWCPACVNEMPALQKLADEYREKGLLITGVVAGYFSAPATNSDSSIAGVLNKLDIRYPILLGDERFAAEVAATMNNVYPGSWAIGPDGHLIEFVSGAANEEKWRAYFDQWLEETR